MILACGLEQYADTKLDMQSGSTAKSKQLGKVMVLCLEMTGAESGEKI